MTILLTIAARGGSKGVKNKNIRPLCGKPLIAFSIEQAKQWGKANHIIVTTDSEEIAGVARSFGAEVPFLRPSELATDFAGKVPALRHALVEMERLTGKNFDIIVDLDPTAPLRAPCDIEKCLQLFLDKKPKTLFSVVPAHKSPYFNMIEFSANGFAELSKSHSAPILRRQDAPSVYAMNASIYFYSRDYLINPENISAISDESICYVMSEMAAVDIDREVDFKFVEFLVREGIICI